MAITIRPTSNIAGSIIVATAAALLAVALVLPGVALAQSPAPAPAPGEVEVAAAPPPGGGGAGAPGPSSGGLDCISYLVNMSDCLTYVEEGSNLTKPDKGCCGELAGLVDSQPICLCQLLSNKVNIGINVDFNQALKLPSVCAVQTPSVSLCSVAGYPIGVPLPSEAPGGMSPGGSAASLPGAGNRASASTIALSQLLLSFLVVGLTTAAFLTTPLSF